MISILRKEMKLSYLSVQKTDVLEVLKWMVPPLVLTDLLRSFDCLSFLTLVGALDFSLLLNQSLRKFGPILALWGLFHLKLRFISVYPTNNIAWKWNTLRHIYVGAKKQVCRTVDPTSAASLKTLNNLKYSFLNIHYFCKAMSRS